MSVLFWIRYTRSFSTVLPLTFTWTFVSPASLLDFSFVFLCVCLLATSRKNCWSDLYENFTRDVFVNKKKLVKFWKSSASKFGYRNFLKIHQHYKICIFPQFGSYLWKNWSDLRENFITDVSLDIKVRNKYQKLSSSGSLPDSILIGFAAAEVCTPWVLFSLLYFDHYNNPSWNTTTCIEYSDRLQWH